MKVENLNAKIWFDFKFLNVCYFIFNFLKSKTII